MAKAVTPGGVCVLGAAVLLFGACAREDGGRTRAARARNVLFLSVDDLGPYLGCYGSSVVRTPAIDRLAARGVLFERAYVQHPVCAPSRAVMMTGRRPDTTGVRLLKHLYRDALPDAVVLPELFRLAGYETRSLGKFQHGTGDHDDPLAWSEPPWRPAGWQTYYAEPETRDRIAELRSEAALEGRRLGAHVFASEAPDVEDEKLPDGRTAAQAIAFLAQAHQRPFFLGVGFLKPHLPFVAPKRYWDALPPAAGDPAANPPPPTHTPPWLTFELGEPRRFADVPDEGELGAELERELVRGYLACVAYVDAQIGRVLEALERLDLERNTVVVLWGDNGFHLGDFGLWGKGTPFEASLRTPLIVSAPGRAAGARCRRLVEAVDLYPTLAELCGLAAPAELEGTSFVPLLDDPERPWKRAVFGEAWTHPPEHGAVLARTVRTERYRLIEWAPEGTQRRLRLLYDYAEHPYESENLAGRPEYDALVEELSWQLHAGWRSALPPPAGDAGD